MFWFTYEHVVMVKVKCLSFTSTLKVGVTYAMIVRMLGIID